MLALHNCKGHVSKQRRIPSCHIVERIFYSSELIQSIYSNAMTDRKLVGIILKQLECRSSYVLEKIARQQTYIYGKK